MPTPDDAWETLRTVGAGDALYPWSRRGFRGFPRGTALLVRYVAPATRSVSLVLPSGRVAEVTSADAARADLRPLCPPKG